MRGVMTDILNEINSPKQITNTDCLKVLADILKYILTCNRTFILNYFIVFVHE